ncbi:MAG: hypothetical protein KC434_16185, partial [Anaerolineales bacterium]|nr:hypothetical protein [Anaerolineales bacterium]
MSVWRMIPLAFLLVWLAACGPSETDATPIADENSSAATAVPTTPSPVNNTIIDDEEARALMFNLTDGSPSEVDAALAQILEAGDPRFIAVLIELLRGRQIGLVQYPDLVQIGESLDALSGQSWGIDWAKWITWYGGTDLTPPPGFTSWKGQLLAQIDPTFGQFLQDSQPSNVRVE